MDARLHKKAKAWGSLTFLLLFTLILIPSTLAVPSGPTINVLANSTKAVAAGVLVNSSINGTISPGGYIFTLDLDGTQQNTRWKAYVGNVTGTLTLDDAGDNTIFQWSITDVTGEVYATRSDGTINWTGINCTWIADNQHNRAEGANSNRTAEHDENLFLGHTGSNDNISATFNLQNHSEISVGTVTIGKDECFAVSTYQNDAAQSFGDSDDANFTQVILYDGASNSSDGNIVYATEIYDDTPGYRSDSTYDFQMILPETSASGAPVSTGYYFYVELS